MSAAPDIAAVIAELRDMAERATALADLLAAPTAGKEPRPAVEPAVGEVVERLAPIDEEIKFGHINAADF